MSELPERFGRAGEWFWLVFWPTMVVGFMVDVVALAVRL